MPTIQLEDDEIQRIVQILRTQPMPWEISHPLLVKITTQLAAKPQHDSRGRFSSAKEETQFDAKAS
jgi:hypothetical protein